MGDLFGHCEHVFDIDGGEMERGIFRCLETNLE